MSSIVIHAHFYQPPRENPWTGAIDREDSAHPYHDWNERIHAECYRANAFARIMDGRGRVDHIVNNYLNFSFNFGPTLLNWLETAHPEAYGRILEADRQSTRLRHGHGNAIAQGYNHAILPLCNERDRRTQVIWGIADFRYRFRRDPESLWMPETACNDATLETLIDAGMSYAILSPHQAQRVRPIGTKEWRDVSNGSIDPRLPYRYFHRDGSGRSIALFFYDDALARAIAFENALASSAQLAQRLDLARGGDGKFVNVATDGESYGHHFRFGDRCIAYALETEAPARDLVVTNYAEFLEQNPPADEVQIKPGPNGEGTAWSCAHGVGRWYRDCGCQTGGQEGWNQAWRGPLRQAFDLLRDRSAKYFEEVAGDLFRDPWAARDDYISVMLERGRGRDEFLARHAGRRLRDAEAVRALNLFEMQRAAMLMYTSCGWFFTEVSGLETVQVMKYAARVLDFMDELDLDVPTGPFLDLLSAAKSNIPEMGNGADVYRRFVQPARATPQRFAAHLAISSLADHASDKGEVGDYHFHKINYIRREHGRLTLATCRVQLTQAATGRDHDLAVAAMHLGGLDFYCTLKLYPGHDSYERSVENLSTRFQIAPLPALLRLMQEEFGPNEYGLDDVLADGRWAIGEMVLRGLTGDLTAQFMHMYETDQRNIEMLHNAGFELPSALRLIAEFTLARRFEDELRRAQGSHDPAFYDNAAAIAEEIARRRYRMDKTTPNLLFSEMVTQTVRDAAGDPSPAKLRAAFDTISIAKRLRLEPNFEPAQEAVYEAVARRQPGSASLLDLGAALELSRETLTKLGEEQPKSPPLPAIPLGSVSN